MMRHWGVRFAIFFASIMIIPAAITLGVAFAVSKPATPDTYSGDGLWYFDWYKIQDFHDQGIDGSGVIIAMIDSPVNLEVPTLRGADITPIAPMGCSGEAPIVTTTDIIAAEHGTNVASFIVGSGAGYPGQTGVKGIAPGARLLAYAVPIDGEPGSEQCANTSASIMMANAIHDAVARGADVITTSVGVGPSQDLIEALADAAAHEVVVVAALQNHDKNFTGGEGYPDAYNTVLSVGSVRPDGRPATDSYGQEVTDYNTDVVAPGVDLLWQGGRDGNWGSQRLGAGNSIATPITAAVIALVMQKYPAATPGQILNSLTRNTGANGTHDPVFDSSGSYGYGVVDAISFLAADPTQYEDANPFLETMSRYAARKGDPSFDDGVWGPTQEQINAYLSDTDTPASPAASSTESVDGSPGVVTWVLLGSGVLVVVAVSSGFVFYRVRRDRRNKYINSLTEQLRQAQAYGDSVRANALLIEINNLQRR